MRIALNTSITVWLIASAVTLTGQDSQTRLSTARQLLANYTERVRWQHYWLPATVSNSYVSGTEVQVRALFARTAAGFCAPALEICQIYERDANGSFEFLTEWEAERNQPEASLPARFAEEYAHVKELRPIQGPGSTQRQKEQRTFDVTKMVEPVRSRQSVEAFDGALSLSWKLLPLIPPKSVSAKIVPSDSSFLRGEVLTTVKRFRKGCSAGQVVIPFYSSQDPRVFVYVDLGGRCEKGILEFLKNPAEGWSFSRFVVDETDVKPLVPRIQKARMESLRLAS